LYAEQGSNQAVNLDVLLRTYREVLAALGRSSEAAGLHERLAWSGNAPGMKFCWCPAGRFTMGSPPGEKHVIAGSAVEVDNERQVLVTIGKGFWLGKHEVTQAEWQRVMGTRPWLESQYPQHVKRDGTFPAVEVSQEDAGKFCEELTRTERAAGRLPVGWAYRLPTEAQWEYACRAGRDTRYCFGDDSAGLGEYAWYAKNAKDAGEDFAHEVGTKRANDWGMHDMHGNVREWCRDVYRRELPGGADPEAVDDGGRDGGLVDVVERGGHFGGDAQDCLSARRGYNLSVNTNFSIGFRVAVVQLTW
jgi:formylglycine-generating enzyme required for sulfatase activity